MMDNARVQLFRVEFVEMANFVFGEAAIFFDVAFDLIERVEGMNDIEAVEGFDVAAEWVAVEAAKRVVK